MSVSTSHGGLKTCGNITAGPDALMISLENYASWLSLAQVESTDFQRFREQWPSRFFELCKLHLAVLIEMPLDLIGYQHPAVSSFENAMDTGESERTLSSRKPIRSWYRLRHMSKENENCETINLSIEGIFRKTGNVTRQRVLRQRILTDRPLQVNSLFESNDPRPTWRPAGARGSTASSSKSSTSSGLTLSSMSIHDLASGLKGVLYDLPEPLLTRRLLPLFVQVAVLTAGRVDERGNRVRLRPIEERIASAKQLKALRLLCLILPTEHAILLKRLLNLLRNTLEHAVSNRMTPESLGTLFGPLLFSPGKVHPRDLHNQYTSLARLATLMINEGVHGLWKIPITLAQDVERNYSRWNHCARTNLGSTDTNSLTSYQGFSRSPSSTDSGIGWTDCTSSHSQPSSCHISDTEVVDAEENIPALITCINFTAPESKTTSCHGETDHSVTDYAVAELCATVQSLPDHDKRKRRLIQRFNATNGGLVPPKETDLPGSSPHSYYLGRNDSSPSPCQSTFIRSTTGTSTFKAAKTIRSSLRPLMESRLEMDTTSDYTLTTPIRTRSPHLQRFPSPVFDSPSAVEALPLSTVIGESFCFPSAPFRLPDITRVSMVSMTSISSMGAGDLFLCCPLVEVIASPFRKRAAATPTQRCTNNGSEHSTGTKWSRIGACKRLRAFSNSRSSENTTSNCERADTNLSTIPSATESYTAISPFRSTVVQKSILSFGFRTVARSPIHQNGLNRLRRVQTMPSLLEFPSNKPAHDPRTNLSVING